MRDLNVIVENAPNSECAKRLSFNEPIRSSCRFGEVVLGEIFKEISTLNI